MDRILGVKGAEDSRVAPRFGLSIEIPGRFVHHISKSDKCLALHRHLLS
jgi:hypothetical protein